MDDHPVGRPNVALRALRFLIAGILLPAAVLYGGYRAADHLMATSPRAQRKPHPRRAHLVEVVPVELGRHGTSVTAMGTVGAARAIELRARVAGEVVSVSPNLVPGGRFAENEKVLEIDGRDHEQVVKQRQSDLARAQSALDLEKGQQAVALRELELLGESVEDEDRDLVLRKPQLLAAEADVAAAAAALEKAKLEAARTVLKAPFPSVVLERSADKGAQLSTAASVARIVGTEEFWVEALVPVERLRWLRFPRKAGEQGAPATITNPSAWGPDAGRKGHVLRKLPGLDEKGRMARVLVSVSDPLCLEDENADLPPLLLGSYVRLEIQGPELAPVAVVARDLLRDGDRVWLMDGEDRLTIRDVEVAFRGETSVLVAGGLAAGDRIVVTDLAAPVPGLPLRLASDGAERPEDSEASGRPAAMEAGR